MRDYVFTVCSFDSAVFASVKTQRFLKRKHDNQRSNQETVKNKRLYQSELGLQMSSGKEIDLLALF